MRHATSLAVAAALLLAGCTQSAGNGDAPDKEAEDAAHEALTERLHAMVEGDWEYVYDLTAHESRPNDRSDWLERRTSRDDEIRHRCVGEPSTRPDIDLVTVEHRGTTMLVEATVWVHSDQGTVCYWRVLEEATGWRVGDYVDRPVGARNGDRT